MYGFKYLRNDLQNELIGHARAGGIAFIVDANGFIVVQSKDDHHRLEALYMAIDQRILGNNIYSHSSDSLESYRKTRDAKAAQNLPFIESETISDPPPDWLHRPDMPAIWHMYCLSLINDFPPGQEPWRRK